MFKKGTFQDYDLLTLTEKRALNTWQALKPGFMIQYCPCKANSLDSSTTAV